MIQKCGNQLWSEDVEIQLTWISLEYKDVFPKGMPEVP